MDDLSVIKEGYREVFGRSETEIIPLPPSGSDRRYFRIMDGDRSVIGAYNSNQEENEAFVGFTEHFRKKNLPVPEVFGYLPSKFVYFQQDLGDDNLYTWLHKKKVISPFDSESSNLYRKIFDNLILFQIKGIEGLNLDLCYPHRSFDRQSIELKSFV